VTLAEIRELTSIYLGRSSDPIVTRLARTLRAICTQAQVGIEDLKAVLSPITDAAHADELSGRADFRGSR
jgi:hypothetical protein